MGSVSELTSVEVERKAQVHGHEFQSQSSKTAGPWLGPLSFDFDLHASDLGCVKLLGCAVPSRRSLTSDKNVAFEISSKLLAEPVLAGLGLNETLLEAPSFLACF